MPIRTSRTNFRLIAVTAARLCLMAAAASGVACSDSSLDPQAPTDGAEVTLPVSTQTYNGPGSVWSADLASDGTFLIQRRPAAADPVDLTVSGEYVRFPSGFVQLVVGDAIGADAPSAESQAWGLEIQGYTLLLRPVDDSSDQIIPMVAAGQCPTEDFDANWVIVKKSSSRDATDPTGDFFGTFSYQTATVSASLPSRFALSTGYPDQGANSIASGSCENGTVNMPDAQMFLAANGGAIVNTNLSNPSDASFIFALKQRAISNIANLDAQYAGMLFNSAGPANDRIKPVSISCSAGACSGSVVTDIETGALSSETVSITLDNLTDGLANGIATGQITQGSGTGNLACMADVDTLDRGSKIISCVGQSPDNPAQIFNIVMVNRATVAPAMNDTISGTLQLLDGDDVLGLDGTAFAYRVAPSPNVVRFQTFSSGSEFTTYDLGDRAVTLSGTAPANTVFPMQVARQNSWYLDGASVDRMNLGGSTFDLGSYRLMVPVVTLDLGTSPGGTAGEDALPRLSSSDVSGIWLGGVQGVYGIQVWDATRRIARYQLDNRQFGGM